jgi:hypothetical protein
MRVRSLLVPPGYPDFLTRTRIVPRGAIDIEGRAWSGRAVITKVDVSTDGGQTWDQAGLEPPATAQSWQHWRYRWDAASPGRYELCCRAYDAAGNAQPLDQHWTARGMGNNAIHRVPVEVI